MEKYIRIMEQRHKLEQGMAVLLEREDICIAFSGGVDSGVLLKAACEAAVGTGHQVHAVTFETSLHPQADLADARHQATEIGAVFHVLHVNEHENTAILDNPVDRCYLCKKYMFQKLIEYAASLGIHHILEGSNEDDKHMYRPGLRAIRELGVLRPLAELCITKAEVRRLAGFYGLRTASKPSAPCLATRLPYGARIDFAVLAKIDQGERWMKGLGFEIVRLRLHGQVLRIEIPKDRFPEFMGDADAITSYMKGLGFDYVTLDMEGFRSGSMDIHVK